MAEFESSAEERDSFRRWLEANGISTSYVTASGSKKVGTIGADFRNHPRYDDFVTAGSPFVPEETQFPTAFQTPRDEFLFFKQWLQKQGLSTSVDGGSLSERNMQSHPDWSAWREFQAGGALLVGETPDGVAATAPVVPGSPFLPTPTPAPAPLVPRSPFLPEGGLPGPEERITGIGGVPILTGEEELQAIIGRLVFFSSDISLDPETGKFYRSDLAFAAVPSLVEIPKENAEAFAAFEARRLAAPEEEEPVTELTPFEAASLEQRERELGVTSRESALRAQLERERLLASLSGPRDWIKFWFATHPAGPSPRAQTFDRLRGVEQQIRLSEETLATEFAGPLGGLERLRDPRFGGIVRGLQTLRAQRAKFTEALETASDIPTQALPDVPETVSQFLIGLEAGDPLRAARVRTPSPQQLERVGGLQGEAFQGLLGFAEFATAEGRGLPGQRTPGRIISDIERALPGRRGQLTRIRPAQQRSR